VRGLLEHAHRHILALNNTVGCIFLLMQCFVFHYFFLIPYFVIPFFRLFVPTLFLRRFSYYSDYTIYYFFHISICGGFLVVRKWIGRTILLRIILYYLRMILFNSSPRLCNESDVAPRNISPPFSCSASRA